MLSTPTGPRADPAAPLVGRARSASVTKGGMVGLTLGALGVVFGDIGTSPLYALQAVFTADGHAVHPTPGEVYGVISLVFWSITMIVSVKYVTFIMRADNHADPELTPAVRTTREAYEEHRRPIQLPARPAPAGEGVWTDHREQPCGGEIRWPPVGRNHGHQWGEMMAAVGEKQMAVDNARLSLDDGKCRVDLFAQSRLRQICTRCTQPPESEYSRCRGWPCSQNSQPRLESHQRRDPRHEAGGLGN